MVMLIACGLRNFRISFEECGINNVYVVVPYNRYNILVENMLYLHRYRPAGTNVERNSSCYMLFISRY
ncbi:MAG: hypothetical protein LBJ57_05355 [Prevotellaceae bacterium]|nr:hypothetical protein [Prevotellaceae bacterium]